MKVGKILASLVLVMLFVVGCDPLPQNDLIFSSLKAVSEYGVYFGMKAGNVEDDHAKIAEESIRVAVQLMESDSVTGMVDIDKVLAELSPSVRDLIEPALSIVDSKYVELKGKIPADKVPYINAVLNGAFAGIENYRKQINEEVSTQSVGLYESSLRSKYVNAKKTLD